VSGQSEPSPTTSKLRITEASRTAEILRWLALIMGATIVILAFVLVLQRQHTIDILRKQVDSIQKDRLQEQQIETCRHLYEADLYFASAAYAQAEGDLVIALAQDGEARRDPALGALQQRTGALSDSVTSLQEYIADPDPPGQCRHPLTQQGE